jgi:oligopeptidase B
MVQRRPPVAVDRGLVFAVAHPRGGGEMGRRWYLDGKFEQKPNTFSDTLACADLLVERGHVAPDRLALRGGSAGGLLVGACINARPDRFAAAVAEVPFVDVVTSMSDASLPLTVISGRWGDRVWSAPAYAAYRRTTTSGRWVSALW